MYIVLKSFAGKEYSGTKGKPIEIKDKDFAKSLIKAGFIAEYSKQDKKNADKDKEIVELKSTISKLTDENIKLEEEKAELILKVQELENASADASTDDTENNGNGTDGATENHSENEDDNEDDNKDTNKASNNK